MPDSLLDANKPVGALTVTTGFVNPSVIGWIKPDDALLVSLIAGTATLAPVFSQRPDVEFELTGINLIPFNIKSSGA